MNIIKCKMCGGDLNIQSGMTVAECLYCGSKQTIPNISDEKKATLYDRAGYYRRNNDYDKAMSIYEQLIAEDNTDAEAHWSAVLCRYGIEYVEDPRSHRRIPTVNRAQYKSILNDPDYQAALRNADSSQYDLYQQEASLIDQIQRGILEVSRKEEPFDIFVCYKETDNQGRRTQDSVYAYDIYERLTQEGYRVFFSRVTLESVVGTAYEPYIFAALNSAKVMIVVGTSVENMNAVWVRNEWSRFLLLMQQDKSKSLIPVYKDMNPYDLPAEFAFLQAQDMNRLGFIQDLVRGIQKILGNNISNTSTQNTMAYSISAPTDNTGALLERAYQFIEDGNWDEAKNYYNKVLDINPKCSSAYLIAAMIDIKAKDRQGLVQYEGQIEENNNFIKAIRFGSEEEKKYLKGIVTEAENVRTKIQFDKAISLMKSNNIRQLTEARNILTRLNNNYDVHNELKQCEKRIAQLLKKRRVTILISLASIAFVVIGSLLLKFIILPYGTYKKACNLLSEEHYTEAIELFESIENYLDSEERIQECKYQYANKFKVGDEIIFGKTGLDLDIDLVWNVIKREDNKALIISKKCIYPEVFNEDLDNSWENSTIRYKLNQMLINSFTDEEKMAIVINEEDISDSIFLLSLEEAEEMGEDIDRVGYLNKKSCDWWLRTGDGELKVRYVDKYGKIRRGERTSKMKSIRPAMWISLDKVSK